MLAAVVEKLREHGQALSSIANHARRYSLCRGDYCRAFHCRSPHRYSRLSLAGRALASTQLVYISLMWRSCHQRCSPTPTGTSNMMAIQISQYMAFLLSPHLQAQTVPASWLYED